MARLETDTWWLIIFDRLFEDLEVHDFLKFIQLCARCDSDKVGAETWVSKFRPSEWKL